MNGLNNKTILLVEDDFITAIVEKKQLENSGYIVHHVGTGEEAVKTILENSLPVDLILMDIDLSSGIDGTQAAEQILNIKDIPVVFLSSHTEPDVVEKTEKITSYGYVVKNSGIVVLDASIKMALKLFDEKNQHRLKEAALQESEKRFYELFERAPLGYQSLDNDGRFLIINQAWLETLGYNKEDVIGKWFGDFLAPEYVEAFRERFPVFKAQGQIHSEFYMSHKNGERRYIAFDGRVGHHVDGSFKQTHCILKDETERKMAEDALRKTIYELKKSQEVAKVGNWVWHIGGRVEWSDEMYKIFGIEKALFTGDLSQVVNNCIHPDDQAEVHRSNSSVIEQKTPIPVEYRIVRPDGSIRTVWAEAGELELDDAGKPVLLRGIVHDITEHKRMEVILSHSEERYRGLITNLNAGVVVHAPDTTIIMNNPIASALLGLSGEQMKGKTAIDPEWKFIKENGDAYPLEDYPVNQIAGTGQTIKNIILGIKRPVVNDIIWVSVNGFPVIDSKGKISEIVISFIDITERKRAEEDIQKQLSEKETLLREVHHRVKNNIANIENFLVLQGDTTDNMEVKRAIKDAVSRVQSIRVLYDKLLLSNSLSEISIKSYVDGLIDSLHDVFVDKNNIIIEKHISDFNINSKRAVTIGIIINELLTNVFKYAFKDSDKGTVSISIQKTENMAAVIIQDNGIGIDERILENKSPGFGLTIVKMLVEQINGTYHMVNDNGTRSVIRFAV